MLNKTTQVHLPKIKSIKNNQKSYSRLTELKNSLLIITEPKSRVVKENLQPPLMKHHQLKPLGCKSYGVSVSDLMSYNMKRKVEKYAKKNKIKSKISFLFHECEYKEKFIECMSEFK
ncbi:hypothetical protein SteCoe_18721 [Stentor coeruleus]|uniref:Uncharacterized protein n=1 Tax=Stentor coeruleus TaxID=5963 RepID=A0A1R2BVQ6_9CILI|nr:hypothetical protein SteCoe_18721 [Stentor coeruleus]